MTDRAQRRREAIAEAIRTADDCMCENSPAMMCFMCSRINARGTISGAFSHEVFALIRERLGDTEDSRRLASEIVQCATDAIIGEQKEWEQKA